VNNLAVKSLNVWNKNMKTTPIICGMLLLISPLMLIAQSSITHPASGISFPAKIEQRFTRGYIDQSQLSGKKLRVAYSYYDGIQVTVNVYPAPAGAKGPSAVDGGPSTDASPAFLKEFQKVKNDAVNGGDSADVVSQSRFHAALHKNGPIGMKATLQTKKNKENHDVLLCERNGYFVSFSVSYPSAAWLQYGLTYTDVGHFIGWPALNSNVTPKPSRKQ